YMPRVRPFPRVRELLLKIRSAGKKVALASSSKKDQLQTLKMIAGIDDLVDCETSADDIESSKPDPDVFHAALKCLDPIRASETVAVGDTPYDASAAAKAGIACIGLLCGGFREQDLRAAGCVEVYRDPAQLLAEYGRSPLVAGSSPQENKVA
ncbi:MAG TPA: HAD-IA family hydrolase, partial [Terriglobales bacterium]|nr:HAD-IA family hydrolase [Terriglobales bacterium]